MRPWRGTFSAAAPTCAFARRSNMPHKPSSVTRRRFLQAGLAAGGGLVVAFHLPLAHGAQAGKQTFSPNAFIRIDGHGQVTLIMPQVEMGQGIYTSMAMILAEELDAAFEHVVLEHAPPSAKPYANPPFGLQLPGRSTSGPSFSGSV